MLNLGTGKSGYDISVLVVDEQPALLLFSSHGLCYGSDLVLILKLDSYRHPFRSVCLLRPIADLSAKAYSHYGSVSSDICIRFGKRLRTLRKQREWTQVYMAEHVGIDRSFISDLENGKKEICIRNLEVLARAFEMTVSRLMARL